ncbi:hypothetical protein HYFRA_00003919 [Hymenoscyphus fraxineus]|uniref:Uncharacterized protein n=1 Tax=Hymenoscyphus fraxineus TaxID=746836 RepID=A0A9N9L3V2_9HELO|nr:hypothetical protein HYFRA_00003919 [Hymenoscyphus fraxineus]
MLSPPFQMKNFIRLVLLAAAVDSTCSPDNCYRALFPCPTPAAISQASAFCATITASGLTAKVYPTRATAACGKTPERYISACKCGPTCVASPKISACTASPTPTAGLLYGDFECGIGSWTVQVPDPAAIAGVTTNGPNTGQKSFQVDFHTPAISPELGVSARLTSQKVSVRSGVPYSLEFYTFFDNMDAGFIGVMFNGVPVRTVDARDNGWGAWHVNRLTWTTASGVTTATIAFEFLFVNTVSSVDRIDSIVFKPA